MDLGTGLTIAGAVVALGGKDIVVKVLGPTAEYMGGEIRHFAEKRTANVKNIFKNASDKLGDNVDPNGIVSPKVLRGTLNEGSYSEDFIGVEYFGGVLASSRTGISRDDRGVFFNSLISRMSTYQLRMHYVLYHAIKRIFNGEDINWGEETERMKLGIFIPTQSFIKSMDFVAKEISNVDIYHNHIINGLFKEQLIDSYFAYGPLDYIKTQFPQATQAGTILRPNRLGFELFYWAYGLGQENSQDFLSEKQKFKLDEKVTIDTDIIRVITSTS